MSYRVEFTESDIINSYYFDTSLNRKLNEMHKGEYYYSLIEETATDTSYFFSIKHNYADGEIENTLYQKIPNDSLLETFTDLEYNITRKYGKRY